MVSLTGSSTHPYTESWQLLMHGVFRFDKQHRRSLGSVEQYWSIGFALNWVVLMESTVCSVV